uniref:Uncharacterized protein n=1 Tax=candidate division WOR-3 bacterium TaxID=2052148 RepID=A0A7C4XF48_UNCW3
MRKIGINGAVLLLAICVMLFAKEIPFTLEDRDRLIKIETTLKEFQASVDKRFESIDKRFESIDKRFDQLTNLMIGIVAAFAGIVAVTIGFAIWDRRTALTPVIRMTQNLEEKQSLIEKALRELALKEPKVAEVLKHIGLL